jgi:hypothetical protein
VRLCLGLALLALLALAGDGSAAPVRVTLIGDSVAEVLAENTGPEQLLGQGLDLQLQTWSCRKLVDPGCYSPDGSAPSVLDVVQQLGTQLGPTVVVDVGYNDLAATYAAGLDQVMTALVAAGVQHVIWVTLEDTEAAWAAIDDVIRAAPARWPQLTVADWAIVAAGKPWFNDAVHLNYDGAVGLATFLRPFLLSACGSACAPPPPPTFCGLARTVNGFDPVSAVRGISCPRARAAVQEVERGVFGPWVCSRAVHAAYELDCRTSGAEVQVLERSPVAAVRHGSVVTLANWSFRLFGLALQGLTGHGRWQTLIARPPYCIPAAPREALAALPLRRVTPAGGCYAPR